MFWRQIGRGKRKRASIKTGLQGSETFSQYPFVVIFFKGNIGDLHFVLPSAAQQSDSDATDIHILLNILISSGR